MSATPKKILITGGAGFIGFHLARHLLANSDANITLTDNFSRGKRDDDFSRLLADPRVGFVELDLTDPASFARLGTGFDHIYHLAAVNGTKWFYKVPHEVLRINTLTLAYLLEWIKGLEKKPKLCFTSSNEAYAGALEAFRQLPIPTPEGVPLVISDPYNPRWTYAGTKLIGEQFVIHYAAQCGFCAVIVRPHNFYGPRAGFDHVIPEFIKRILARESPFVISGADQTRSFCYIEDAVLAMRLLMESPKTDASPVGTFHIGSAEETKIRDLAETLFDALGWHPDEMEVRPPPQGSVDRRLPDVSKIAAAVGWTAATTLADGLRATVDWYRQWYEKNP